MNNMDQPTSSATGGFCVSVTPCLGGGSQLLTSVYLHISFFVTSPWSLARWRYVSLSLSSSATAGWVTVTIISRGRAFAVSLRPVLLALLAWRSRRERLPRPWVVQVCLFSKYCVNYVGACRQMYIFLPRRPMITSATSMQTLLRVATLCVRVHCRT